MSDRRVRVNGGSADECCRGAVSGLSEKSGVAANGQLDESRLDRCAGDCKPPYRYRQFEATRAGTARVDELNAFPQLDAWPMRMPSDDCVKTGCRWIKIERADIVEHVDDRGTDLKYFCFGKDDAHAPLSLLPRTAITGAIAESRSRMLASPMSPA